MLKNVENEEIEEDPSLHRQPTRGASDEDEPSQEIEKEVPSRLLGELKRLSTSYNPDANLHLERLEELASRNEETGRDNLLETANFVREAIMKNKEGVENLQNMSSQRHFKKHIIQTQSRENFGGKEFVKNSET